MPGPTSLSVADLQYAEASEAVGGALTGNPTLMGGSDGAAVRALKTDTTGAVNVIPSGVVPTPLGNGINLWNATVAGAGVVSSFVTVYGMRSWMIAGNVSAATTLTVQVSADTVTFRTTSVQVVLAGAGDFNIDCRPLLGSFYARLLTSAAATITAGLTGTY